MDTACSTLESAVRTSLATMPAFGDATSIGMLVGAGLSCNGDIAMAITEGTGIPDNTASDIGAPVRTKLVLALAYC